MKVNILDIQGKEKGNIELPSCFSAKIREDIVAKVLEAKKTMQPYAPSLVAGKQHSAKGKIVHRRHVWKSGYGRGASRVPRKIFSRRGSQFNWEAAEIPFARGGMRAHPPKVLGMINTSKINKKEFKLAFLSALSATADEKKVAKKYDSIEEVKKLPIIVESKITSLKTKEILSILQKILGENLFNVAIKKKTIRSGKGKLRGRKYKSNAGMLFVVGEKEKLKTNTFDVKKVKNLGIKDLAQGGLGRLTMYTEQAIKELENKFKENKK
ncbi:50S ribosomal protein L4 [Candidatus Pacearchaeota archaeon]|nr:50S ribosomal protein L4 [Candidatus Pacearchaeota archaeon]